MGSLPLILLPSFVPNFSLRFKIRIAKHFILKPFFQAGIGLKLSLPVEQTHALGLARYIVRTEGVRGLYRGIVPNFCKVAPAVSISYYVYERLRVHLGLKMT